MKSSLMLICCVAVSLALPACVGPEVAAGPRVKADNGMTYTHENMGNGRHFLTVWDTRFGVGRIQSSFQSMTIFAHRWCAQKFTKGYELQNADHWDGTGAATFNPSRSFIITETR